jgi:wyosine [tRNA(Phe)-imidazoG37] synthetase (radical SAM superfamily)
MRGFQKVAHLYNHTYLCGVNGQDLTNRMPTFLHNNIVFGPVKSRRLGNSLGMNILSADRKICSFNCIYCECGFNEKHSANKFPTREEIKNALEYQLQTIQLKKETPDTITFSGNGEPTLHPEFEGIIDDTIALRNQYFPQAKISVLSNATQIDKDSVFKALNKVDNNILKLDAATDSLIGLIDQPVSAQFNIRSLVENLKKFNGNLIIQTIFLRGVNQGKIVDNTTEENIVQWLELLKEIQPKQVMIYSLDRETPSKTIEKVSVKELSTIAEKVKKLGIPVEAY